MNQFVVLENSIKRLHDILERFYPEDKKIDFNKYLEKADLLQSLSEHQGSVTLLLDIQRFDIFYLSGDIFGHFGYTIDEIKVDKLKNIFKLIDAQSILFPINGTNWYLNTLKRVSAEHKRKQIGAIWGITLKHKNGKTFRCLFSCKPLEFDEDNKPILFMVVMSDITHLLKNDTNYWFKLIFGETDKKIFTYQSSEDTTIEQEILTEREKEILNYIADGNDTKNIASILNISPNTVDNHRRNMIARTGTRDTTALIQLCKMMNVL